MQATSLAFCGIAAWLCVGLLTPDHCVAQTWYSIEVSNVDRDNDIEQALTRRGSVEFTEKPLHQVLTGLSRQFQVQMVLAHKKLEEASVSPDTPVTKKLEDLSLESILRLVLSDLELTFTIRNEVLVITTPEDAESQLITRVYPVLDLLPRSEAIVKRTQPGETAFNPLIDLIVGTIQPDSWRDVGGPGAIDLNEKVAALVVSQTRDVHRSVEGLLAALRRAKEAQGLTEK